MKHIHMDEFAKLKSPLHSMDPRAKALAFLFFIFLTVNLTRPVLLLAAASFWLGLLFIARIPISYVIKRVTWIIPFAGFLILLFPFITPGDPVWSFKMGSLSLMATVDGLEKALMLFMRVVASVLVIVTLTATTRFTSLMKAMTDLRVPRVIVQMVEFTIRYIFVAIDELKRMRRSRRARGFAPGKNIWHAHTVRTLAQLVGTMFLRAYERGDRVYVAMLSRGFTGNINTMTGFTIRPLDYLKAGAISLVAVALFLLDKGGFIS